MGGKETFLHIIFKLFGSMDLFINSDFSQPMPCSPDNVPLREKPDEDAKRVTHLGVDTVLMINGKKGDYILTSRNQALLFSVIYQTDRYVHDRGKNQIF